MKCMCPGQANFLQNSSVYAIAGLWFMGFYILYVIRQFLHINMATNFYQWSFEKITDLKANFPHFNLFLILDDIQKWC